MIVVHTDRWDSTTLPSTLERRYDTQVCGHYSGNMAGTVQRLEVLRKNAERVS